MMKLALLPFCLVGILTAQDWPARLSAQPAETFEIAGATVASSSRLRLNWSAPERPVDRYILRATDGRHLLQQETIGPVTTFLWPDLNSATTYAIYLQACLDAACEQTMWADAPIEASLPEEHWQIIGTGHSATTAHHVIEDGNVGSWAFRYGPWA